MKAKFERDSKPFRFRPRRDCDKNGNTNAARAERAALTLQTYCEAAGFRSQDEFDPSALQDLICDLAHLADRDGLDIADAVEYGIYCYMEER